MTLSVNLQVAVAQAKIRNALSRDARNLRVICDFAEGTVPPQEVTSRVAEMVRRASDNSRLARDVTRCSDCLRECDEIDRLLEEITRRFRLEA